MIAGRTTSLILDAATGAFHELKNPQGLEGLDRHRAGVELSGTPPLVADAR